MEKTWIDDRMFRILFCVMVGALIVLAIIPRKIMLVGSANDSTGNFTMGSGQHIVSGVKEEEA